MNTDYVLVPRLLPYDSPSRCGTMDPKWITIHETTLGTDIKDTKNGTMYGLAHYEELLHPPNPKRIGYHYLVEANYGVESRVYQFLEPTVMTHHTGTEKGNLSSIGIERLVNTDTDFERAIAVQARLTAMLMATYNIPIRHVVPHKYWSGKECPARLLAGMFGGWDGFIETVKKIFIEIYGDNSILLK